MEVVVPSSRSDFRFFCLDHSSRFPMFPFAPATGQSLFLLDGAEEDGNVSMDGERERARERERESGEASSENCLGGRAFQKMELHGEKAMTAWSKRIE